MINVLFTCTKSEDQSIIRLYYYTGFIFNKILFVEPRVSAEDHLGNTEFNVPTSHFYHLKRFPYVISLNIVQSE